MTDRVRRTFTIDGFTAVTAASDLRERGGFLINPGGLTGWDSSVAMRRERTDRPNGPGTFAVPGYLGSRTVAISGTCSAPSAVQLNALRRELTSVLAGGDFDTFSETGTFGRWSASAGRADEPQFDYVGLARRHADWQLQLWCPDPRKYGEPHVFLGSAPVYHYGNATALPKLTVTARTTTVLSYGVEGPPGHSLVVVEPLVPGIPHEISMRDGLVRVGGEVVPGAAERFSPWGIPRSAQVSHVINGDVDVAFALSDTDI